MIRTEIHDELRRYIARELLAGDDEGLDGATRLLETGIIDSMAMVDLLAYVEQRFDVIVPETEVKADHFATLSTVTDLVLRLRRENGESHPSP